MRHPSALQTRMPNRLRILPLILAVAVLAACAKPVSQAGTAGSQPGLASPSSPSVQSGLSGSVQTAPAVRARLAAGLLHSALINYDGQLLMWGDNTYGQIGAGTLDYSDIPLPVGLPGEARSVSLGAYHTLVALADGSVYAFGRNAFGQLGNGTTANAHEPVQVTGLPPIKAVAAGSYHSLALAEDGTVWAWGNNSQMQVGDIISSEIRDAGGQVVGSRCILPACVVFSGAVAIAAGDSHSLYLNDKGAVFAWGDNSAGQLGDGSTQSHARPIQVPGVTAVAALAAGYRHSLALCRLDGHDALMAWGDDSLGQLGLGSDPASRSYRAIPERIDVSGDNLAENDRIDAIAAGYAQSAALVPYLAGGKTATARQQLLVWGSNAYGQLGLGSTDSPGSPVAVSGIFDHWSGDHFLPFDAIALGGYHSLVLSSKGILAAAGRGDSGQLGNQSVLTRSRLTVVDTPDLIRPAWLAGSEISLTYNADLDLVVRWPAAQDNRVVAGYKLIVEGSDGYLEEIDAGMNQVQVIRAARPNQAYQVTVLAYDADSAFAALDTLSRLTGSILPDNAPDGAKLADYLQNVKASRPRADLYPNRWQPDRQGLIRPLEMPWDMAAIYGPDSVDPPPSRWIFPVAAAVASALLLAVLAVIIRRPWRQPRLAVRPIRAPQSLNPKST